MDPDKEIQGVLDDAFAKYKLGEEKHGVLDIDNDPRNFLKEAEDELLDAMVYCAAEILRLRRLNKRLTDRSIKILSDSIQARGVEQVAQDLLSECAHPANEEEERTL